MENFIRVTDARSCVYFLALDRPYRLAVRTPPFHGGGTGSIPVRVAIFQIFLFLLFSYLVSDFFKKILCCPLQPCKSSVINAPPAMDQIEAYRQIVQLQSEIVKISRRNRELRDRCEELERALSEGVPAEVITEESQGDSAVPPLQEG